MWILLHLLPLPAAWAIYFPKTCSTTKYYQCNAAALQLHVRTHRPLVAFSVLYLDDFSRLIVPLTHLHSRSGAGGVEKNSPTWSFYSLFDEVFIRVSSVGFQPWNPGYWRGLLTFHVQAVPSSSLVVDGPKVCKFLFNRIWCDYFLSQSHLGCSCIVQTGFRIWSTWHDAIIPNMMICMRVHKDPFHVKSIFLLIFKKYKIS